MASFVKAHLWSWKHVFTGQMSVLAELGVTEQQVRSWIEQSTSRGGSGNHDSKSLVCKQVKVKASKFNPELRDTSQTNAA